MSGRGQNNYCYDEEVGEPRRSRHILNDARRARPEQAITSHSILSAMALPKPADASDVVHESRLSLEASRFPYRNKSAQIREVVLKDRHLEAARFRSARARTIGPKV